jgi:very-short-patch-repair endonuclease
MFNTYRENEKAYLEYWIPEILNFVDIYLPDKHTVVEVNGPTHYKNEKLNTKSLFKQTLLEHAGFKVINVCV